MTKHLLQRLMVVALAAAVSVMGALRADAQATQPDLTGAWQMTIVHGQDHGVPIGLELKHNDDNVTGVLHTPHGDKVAVSGHFKDNTLHLSSDAESATGALTVTGDLKADGTLQGVLSGKMGRMTWTAERLGKPRAR